MQGNTLSEPHENFVQIYTYRNKEESVYYNYSNFTIVLDIKEQSRDRLGIYIYIYRRNGKLYGRFSYAIMRILTKSHN